MSFFGKLKKVANIVTLGGVTFFEQQIELAGRLLTATIDVKNQIVRIGEDVFRAAPGELFYPGLGPLAGILKNEIEDELILLSPLGIVPSIDVYFPVDPLGAIIVIGDLVGKVQHRTMLAREREIARYLFGDELKHIDNIHLTSLVGLDGNPFAAPMYGGGASVHLGPHYRHDSLVENIPLLMHELTHVWQLDHGLLVYLSVCEGLFEAARDTIGQDVYSFLPGKQWSEYGVEQQASIVQAWGKGATERPARNFNEDDRRIFTINSPLFRYINANVRRGTPHAPTRSGRSLRNLLADAGHRTVRDMLPPRPRVTWPASI